MRKAGSNRRAPSSRAPLRFRTVGPLFAGSATAVGLGSLAFREAAASPACRFAATRPCTASSTRGVPREPRPEGGRCRPEHQRLARRPRGTSMPASQSAQCRNVSRPSQTHSTLDHRAVFLVARYLNRKEASAATRTALRSDNWRARAAERQLAPAGTTSLAHTGGYWHLTCLSTSKRRNL